MHGCRVLNMLFFFGGTTGVVGPSVDITGLWMLNNSEYVHRYLI